LLLGLLAKIKCAITPWSHAMENYLTPGDCFLNLGWYILASLGPYEN
jgi:hypothetical protein